MSDVSSEVFKLLQRRAQSDGAKQSKAPPTQEYLTRHALESFLERLTRTPHADDFILKGGILLGAYGVRRPTKDVDANAVSADVSAEHITTVVEDVSAVEAADGVLFNPTTISVDDIREGAEYPGLRMRVKVTIGTWNGTVAWDVSTGDPIVPAPKRVQVDRVLGEPIEMLAYTPETIIAEKGVTILQRGITSTRWRDYIDIVRLFAQGIDEDELLRSARAVALYRRVELEPVGPFLDGYGAVGQTKWAAWRRKEHLEDVSEESLDAQAALVAFHLDPTFGRGAE